MKEKPMGPRPDFKDHALNPEVDAEGRGSEPSHYGAGLSSEECPQACQDARQVLSGARQGHL